MSLAVKVYGDPVPKGSMKCIGARGRGHHTLIDTKADKLTIWEPKIIFAAKALLVRSGKPLAGPVVISLTLTVERPPSVPLARRAWPITRSAGDLDKLQRAVFDGLTKSGLIADDSQIVGCTGLWKCYPDTPGCPDRLERPGALIRIETIE